MLQGRSEEDSLLLTPCGSSWCQAVVATLSAIPFKMSQGAGCGAVVELAPGPASSSQYPKFKWKCCIMRYLRHSGNRMSPVLNKSPFAACAFCLLLAVSQRRKCGEENSFTATRCLGRGRLPRCGGCYLKQTLVARTLLPSWGTEERPLWVSSQESAPLVLRPRAGEIWTCSGAGELSTEARALKEPLRQQSTQKRLTEWNLQQNLCKLVCRAGLCCTHKPACWLKRGS